MLIPDLSYEIILMKVYYDLSYEMWKSEVQLQEIDHIYFHWINESLWAIHEFTSAEHIMNISFHLISGYWLYFLAILKQLLKNIDMCNKKF